MAEEHARPAPDYAEEPPEQSPEYDAPRSPGDGETGGVEDLACSTRGLQRQAEVTTGSLPQLETFKTQFETARADYTKARDLARTSVRAAREQVETIRCQLHSLIGETERDRLREALRTVVQELQDCAGSRPGCCVEDVGFDDVGAPPDQAGETTVAGGADEISRLAGLIERYKRDTKKASDCFTALIQEQTDLPQRVATIKSELGQLETDVLADPEHLDIVRHWARLLVANYRLQGVWQGFASVRSYVDCLQEALVVTLRGSEAIARVEGQKATLECCEEAAVKVCARMQSDTVGEVLSEYERRWPPEEDGADAEAEAW